MDDWVLRVAETLEKARAEAGISQATLAKRMGVSRQSVIKWEQGINAISFPMMMQWFVGCGVSLERYLDSCIHPGLLERLEEDPTDKEKRRMLHEAIEECSAYEVDTLLYIRYGAHGSDHLSVLTEMVANLHTPLREKLLHILRIAVPPVCTFAAILAAGWVVTGGAGWLWLAVLASAGVLLGRCFEKWL